MCAIVVRANDYQYWAPSLVRFAMTHIACVDAYEGAFEPITEAVRSPRVVRRAIVPRDPDSDVP